MYAIYNCIECKRKDNVIHGEWRAIKGDLPIMHDMYMCTRCGHMIEEQPATKVFV